MRRTALTVAFLVFLSAFVVIITVLPEAKATTLYVGGTGLNNYTTIQGAINSAGPGYTVYVYSGTYNEKPIVNKPLSLIGEDRDSTVIDGDGIGDVFQVTADWVNVTGFTVLKGGWDSGGVGLRYVENCTISGNRFLNNSHAAIYLYNAPWTRAMDNNVSDSQFGIYIEYSNDSVVVGNEVHFSRANAIHSLFSDNVIIADNKVSSQLGNGILLSHTTNNTVIDNTVYAADTDGVYVIDSDGNYIFHNNVSGVSRCGIDLWRSSYNIISRNNTVFDNGYGIGLQINSTHNTVRDNTIVSNTAEGINVHLSDFNKIYHNDIIDNGQNAYDNGVNEWDIGYPFGGNHWSDYGGVDQKSGPGQDQPGSDGIGDTPYDIWPESNMDRYPLMDFVPDPPDLVAESLTFDPPSPVPPGTWVTLNATISNDGGQTALNFAVTTFEDSNHDRVIQMGEEISTDAVLALDPGEEVSLYHPYFASEIGVHDICVWADPPPDSIEEFREDNNLLCVDLEVLNLVEARPPSNVTATLTGSSFSDVLLSWNLSPDDGNELNPVVGYRVFRGSLYDAGGLSYSLYDSVPNATSEYVDAGAGEGDPSNHFYRVCAVNNANESFCSLNQGAKFTRPLSTDSNLVSVPLIQSNESVETVLQTVAYDKAWNYDPSSQEWRWFMKHKEYRRGLWNMNHTTGMWVNVTRDCNITVAGVVPVLTTIHLNDGWNLISFPSFNTSYSVSDLKAEIGATRVEGHDSILPYFLRVLGDAEMLQAGYGYWVRVEADMDWIIEVS
ncbi:MAG: NosD domain-containing protein [Thermoplasmata archaeon]